MGASMQGGGGRRGRNRSRPMAEINMTPMVDVMLVLLIIFMVAAPLLTVGVPIDLPESQAGALEGDNEPLAISVSAEGKIFLQDTEVALDEIVPKVSAIAKAGFDERIYVRGDQNVDYGTVMALMGRLNAAGFKRIGLVTEQEQN